MSDTSEMLNALFGPHEGKIAYLHGDERVETAGITFPSQHRGTLLVYPECHGKVYFLFATEDDTQRDAYQACRIRPNAVLWRDGVSLYCWALETPINKDDVALLHLMGSFAMAGLDEPIPLPGTNGWELVDIFCETVPTIEQLAAAYLTEMPDRPSPVATASNMYGDAQIILPYREQDHEDLMWITLGKNKKSMNWVSKQMPRAWVIAQLCQHLEGPKDGDSIVYAEMVPGQRLKTAVKSVKAIGLDLDNGISPHVIDEALKRLGCLAVLYRA